MAVTAWQAGVLGPFGPDGPQGIVPAATTVNSTNPNAFAVNVTPTNSVSNATITNVTVNGHTVASAGGTAVVVPANGTIQCTYGSGTLSYLTQGNEGATPVNTGQYPYTDPVFQLYTAQQNLTQPGVNASGTYA